MLNLLKRYPLLCSLGNWSNLTVSSARPRLLSYLKCLYIMLFVTNYKIKG